MVVVEVEKCIEVEELELTWTADVGASEEGGAIRRASLPCQAASFLIPLYIRA